MGWRVGAEKTQNYTKKGQKSVDSPGRISKIGRMRRERPVEERTFGRDAFR